MGVAALAALLTGCFGGSPAPLYPPRPASMLKSPIAAPTPSRVVLHATVTAEALRDALEEAIPKTGEGTFPMLRQERKYTWKRTPIELRFDHERLILTMDAVAHADLPVSSVDIPIRLRIAAEPVVSSEYAARLGAVEVTVSSEDRFTRIADGVAGILDKVKLALDDQLHAFSYDLAPALREAHERLALPVDVPLGDARGCASLRVLSVEAGPTIIAHGVEKDLALVVAPQVTIPCAPEPMEATLPPLANVASVPSGPFTVSIPVAARYDELSRAMGLAFTDGKLFFSKEYPDLYLEDPEVYPGTEGVIVKMHLHGPVRRFGFTTELDGDLFLSGHPVIEDNELRVPDLEPTIETSNFLLRLKDMLDGASIREQARAALRLDLSDRILEMRQNLATNLAFGDGRGCMKAEILHVDVRDVHSHAEYLRLYVDVTASASAYVPCPAGSEPPPFIGPPPPPPPAAPQPAAAR